MFNFHQEKVIKPFRLKDAVSFHPSISIINIVILLFCEDLKSYTKGKSFRLLEQKLYVFIYCLFVFCLFLTRHNCICLYLDLGTGTGMLKVRPLEAK